MVYCSQCHTPNSDSSGFCSECGASLATAQRRCQACGTLNAATQTTCTNCGARLAPMAAGEAASMPAGQALPAQGDPDAGAAAPAVVVAENDASTPEWLRAFRESAGSMNEALAAMQPPTEGSEPTPPAGQLAEQSDAAREIPAWLSDLQSDGAPSYEPPITAENKPAPSTPAVSPPDTSQMPEWLREFRGGNPPALTDTARASPEAPPGQKPPEWLADLHSPSSASPPPKAETPASESSEPEASALAPANLPAWLTDLGNEQRLTIPPQPIPSDAAVDELPAWLKPDPKPTEPRSSATTGQSTLAPGQIPPWLAGLKPGAIAPISGEPIETSGLLAGVRGALPVENVFVKPHQYVPALSTAAKVPVSGFGDLFARRMPPPVEEEIPTKKRRFRLGWPFWVSLVMLTAISLAFLQWPVITEARGTYIAAYQPSRDFYQTVDQVHRLQPDALVLVALDYGAGARDELDPQARAVLRNLLENKQRILTISLAPEGAQLAQDLLNASNPVAVQFPYPYSYGETHLNLGYLSGGEAALRLLAQNPTAAVGVDFRDHKDVSKWPIARNWKSLADLGLIIVFSDDSGDVTHWIEQVGTRPGKSARSIVVGVSKAVEPAVMPYYASKQLNGLLAGTHGACEYEGFMNEPSAAVACAVLEAQGYAAIVLIGGIALSLPAMLFARRRTSASTQ